MTDAQAHRAELAGLSILVVEDDYYQADETRRTLTRAGATVVGPFSSLAAAMRAIEAAAPDCAIVDLNLGDGRPSFELARALKQRGIPVVILSGYDARAVPADLADVTRLEKPISGAGVIGAIRMVTGSRQPSAG